MKKVYIFAIFFIALFIPSSLTFAVTTHTYTCSDFTSIGGGASCSSGTLTFTNSSGYAIDHVNPAPVFNLQATSTWYLSFVANGTGTGRKICESNNGGGGDYCNSSPNVPAFTSGTIVDYQLNTSAETGSVGLYFRDDGAGSPGFSGTVSNICISDTAGDCGSSGGTINRLAKFTSTSTIANSLFSDDGSDITLTSGNLFLQVGALIDTITGGAINFGTSNATSITIGKSGITTTFPGKVSVGSTATASNCGSSASPASCSSAAAGSVALPAGQNTLVVNTSAVTANSQIMITEDSSLGSRLGVTCNTTTGRTYSINARTSGTSFTIISSANPNTDPACLNYWIIN